MNKEEKDILTKKLYNHSQSVPQGDGSSEVMIRLTWAQKQIESMPEVKITYGEAWNKISESYPEGINDVANICNTVMDAVGSGQEVHIIDGKIHIGKIKKDKVKIPQYVADLIESYKEEGVLLRDALDSWRILLLVEEDDFPADEDKKETKTIRWILNNSEKFMSAWLNGYELEKEGKSWIVGDSLGYFMFFNKDLSYEVWTKENAFVFESKEKAQKVAELTGQRVIAL